MMHITHPPTNDDGARPDHHAAQQPIPFDQRISFDRTVRERRVIEPRRVQWRAQPVLDLSAPRKARRQEHPPEEAAVADAVGEGLMGSGGCCFCWPGLFTVDRGARRWWLIQSIEDNT